MEGTLKKHRKGATLAEICVVLAVIAIVSSIVLSFCLLMHYRTLESTKRLQIINEVEAVESMVEAWCDKVISQGEIIVTDGNNLSTDKRSDISFRDHIFSVVTSEKSTTLECETISSVTFEVLNATDSDDQIIFCTVECILPIADGESKPRTYVFCVNSRIEAARRW